MIIGKQQLILAVALAGPAAFLPSRHLGRIGWRARAASAMAQQPHPSQPRCAIITGVARHSGIGRCLVHTFLRHGYKVVGTDIKDLELQQRSNQTMDIAELPTDSFHFVQGDIGDINQAKVIMEQAVQWLGNKIHVLINNAARTAPKDGDRLVNFANTIATNLNGAFYMSEYALPYLVPGESSIIHISSTRALQSEPGTAAYSASKAGLCGLTHSQAISLAGKARVNAVLPGWINTDPRGEEVLRPEDHKWHPVGRVGIPKDVAEMCLFLCDDERAGFITGQQFVVDGGVTKKMVYPED